MKDKDLIKNLKKLKETPVKREFLASLQNDLKKYMEFFPIRKGIKVKVPEAAPFFGLPIFKVTSFALIVILAFGGGGAVFASQKSLPGDILYPIKTLTENLEETLTFDSQKKAYLYTRLAEKRIGEIKNILEERGVEPKGLSIAEKRLVTHIISAEQIVEKELEKGRNGEFAEEITAKLNISREEAKKIFEKEEYQSKVIEILEREQERFEKEIEAIEEEEEVKEAEEDDDSDDSGDDEETEEIKEAEEDDDSSDPLDEEELDDNNDDNEDDNNNSNSDSDDD